VNRSRPFKARREKVYDWMAGEGVALAMVEDGECRRDSNLRWLCGHPSDGLLFLSAERKSLLVPWDVNLAKLYADADAVRAYADFDRLPVKACKKAAEFLKIPNGSKIEIPSSTPYPQFLQYIEALSDYDALCRENGLGSELELLRVVKDEAEIAAYRTVSQITGEVIDGLEKQLAAGKIKTETDAALYIDTESRRRGCEGTGFETLAAGPARSFAIHAFPSYSVESFGGKGLSILDFGLTYRGLTSDVTLTVAKGLSKAQEKLVSLTEKAYKLAASRLKPGVPTAEIAAAVDALFAKSRMKMPHALGHGIGLDAHEAPALRNRTDNEWVLSPGMVVTLEPGLYDPILGGVRLENDFLITADGAEQLTNSRIIRL
jgi:Xaa-Pro dipeptidase